MKGILSPSLMCADMLNIESEVKRLDKLGVEYVHLDFMDNKFVPNITLDTTLIRLVKSVLVNMKRDIHIMAYEAESYFDKMEIGDGDVVSIHIEAFSDDSEICSVLDNIKDRGAKPFLAISPDTPIERLIDFLDKIDGILVMTVYPGFAGQPIVEGSFDRIKAVRELIDSSGKSLLLEVDGHVSWDLCSKMRECGGDMFVAGSSSVYSKGITLDDAVAKMNELIK